MLYTAAHVVARRRAIIARKGSRVAIADGDASGRRRGVELVVADSEERRRDVEEDGR